MEKFFIKNNIVLDKSLIDKIDCFYYLVIEENKKYNLTTIIDKEEFFYKHILDSIYPLFLFKDYSKICDIGAGAGFPSIPLSLLLPNSSFTLLDSVNKKINFLNICKNKLDLKNIQPIHSRIEDYADKNRNTYDYVIGRGVAPLNTFLEYSIPLIKPRARVFAYKGKNFNDEYLSSKNALSVLNSSLIKSFPYSYNFNDTLYERILLIFSKLSPSSSQYPRKKNKPRTEPL